jgi:hypothetical protein
MLRVALRQRLTKGLQEPAISGVLPPAETKKRSVGSVSWERHKETVGRGVRQLGVRQLGVRQLGVRQLGVRQLGVRQLGVRQLGASVGQAGCFLTAAIAWGSGAVTRKPPRRPSAATTSGVRRPTGSARPPTGSAKPPPPPPPPPPPARCWAAASSRRPPARRGVASYRRGYCLLTRRARHVSGTATQCAQRNDSPRRSVSITERTAPPNW